jgi:hypothetical protein
MFRVCMENLRSSFRTSCEQIFFSLRYLWDLSSQLDALFYFYFGSSYHPDGPTPSTQCLYVNSYIAHCGLAFSRCYTYRFLNSLLLQPHLFRHTLYIAVIMSVSINTAHVPNTYPWQIMKKAYVIVGPSEKQCHA